MGGSHIHTKDNLSLVEDVVFWGAVTISFSEPNAQNRTKLYFLNVVMTCPLEKGVNGE